MGQGLGGRRMRWCEGRGGHRADRVKECVKADNTSRVWEVRAVRVLIRLGRNVLLLCQHNFSHEFFAHPNNCAECQVL
jgi:hypothetical protein